ncbi:Sec-independent protein translocase protein TatB [Acinetobacter venetianus]|uniref:Sec-independent protein translocase protein TatB n=1 Tax=Acinetobacter venetianus (strain ATCC 31012 / DSM 23050 / BCRC 14357 / CCUG 45561 / CIP 110063 / KCTC 2702 / LMG 19082 / RAG-1) TaxID=1191460 RepID=N8YNU6_ACIVR|nr:MULTISPECIES: Sec-independent protein translocase protein TatB [Acinetobacter]ENV38376.1 twin arginine-targeting protein translocase TatB [Acinetobacter venetianus RAG-1 = CIP 110063]KXZ66456.1 Sec-independent protein translocase protein TatB [Acinetobacter venetianus]
MLNLGMSELLVFGIIALLVLGPDKLPEAARFVGKWYTKIKRLVSNVQNDIDRELRLSELREQMQKEMQRIAELEQKMQVQINELEQQRASVLAQENSTSSDQPIKVQTSYSYLIQPLALIYFPKFAVLHLESYKSNSDSDSSVSELKVAV